MKLYQATVLNTCPRRLSIYMAEKGIECDVVAVNVRAGEGRSDWFRAINPAGTIPVLELGDGAIITDSAAIVEYLEEVYPDPPMLGRSVIERARIRSMERLATDFLVRNNMVLANTDPSVRVRRPDYKQYPEAAAYVEPFRDRILDALEVRIGDNRFLCGDVPTVADCALFCAVDTGNRLSGYLFPDRTPRLQAWYDRFSARPSAQYPDWAAIRAQPYHV